MKNLILILLFSLSVYGFQSGKDYRKLHFESLVIDCHNDCTMRISRGEDLSKKTARGHSDLPRFIAGGVDVQIFAVFVPPVKNKKSYKKEADQQIDAIENFIKKNRDKVALVRTTDEIIKFYQDGKFCVMIGIEGGHALDNSLENLKHFYDRGVRYITLTWNNSTEWATSAPDEDTITDKNFHKGLSQRGFEIIKKMNELGIIIDVSHLGEKSFWDVIQTTKKPIIASHSSVWNLCPNRRNLTDEQIRAISRNDGVVCINFAPFFIDSSFVNKEKKFRSENKLKIDSFLTAQKKDTTLSKVTLSDFLSDDYKKIKPPISILIDHIEYIVRLVGIDHVGLGSDFDGISVTLLEMDDVSCFPNITRELVNRGYTEKDIKKILGENFLRVLKMNEKH